MTDKIEVKPKKRVNSKAKGNSGERAVCKILAEHLPPFKFIRSQSSGAVVGGKNFQANAHLYSQEAMHYFVSDIVCSNEQDVGKKFRFCIEVKHYKDAEKMEVLLNRKSKVYGWLEEVAIDCFKVNKEGIVIFKFNNTPYYVAVNKNIELPPVDFILLPTGDKVCHLLPLLEHKDFWII
jgi:hypothetical protein